MASGANPTELPFGLIFAESPVGTLVIDPTGVVLAANAEIEQILGWAPQELIGQSYTRLVPVAAREQHAIHEARYRASPSLRRMGTDLEITAMHKDGHDVAVEIALQSLQQHDLAIMAVYITAVSEQRKLTGALRESEARLRELIDQVAEGIVVMDATSARYMDVNAAALRFFGLTREQFLAGAFGSLSPPRQPSGQDSCALIAEHAAVALREGSCNFEWRFIGAGGRERPASVRMNRMAGSRQLLRASLVDLSEQRLAEQRYRTLFDNAVDGVLLVDGLGVVVEANQRAASLVNVASPALLLGTHFVDFIAEQDQGRAFEAFGQAMSRGSVQMENVRVRRTDGALRLIDATASLIELSGVPYVLAMARDVTARYELQAQIAIADRMVSIGTLAAGVAHEINNPLASVFVNVELALGQIEALRSPVDQAIVQQLREELRDARDAADRVRAIVRDLRLFSRSDESGASTLEVSEVLDSSIRMAWNEIRHRACLVRNYGKVPEVSINPGRLGQVFLNLLVNAAQAIAEGRAEANEITVTTRLDDEGRVAIDIEDTGSGLSPEVTSRLFTAFFTTKPPGTGTGLGLSISQRIVRDAGGELTARNRPGRGAVFTVHLPVAGPAPVAAAPRALATLAAPRARLLVVDDERAIAVALVRALEREHDVVMETSSALALARVTSGERYDVILTDLMMPQLTGAELYAAIQKLDPGQAARMIFLSGGAFTRAGHDFLDTVPNLKLEKPFELDHLRLAIAEARRRS